MMSLDERLQSKNATDAMFLVFNTKHDCQLIKGKVVDGEGHVGDKDFVVDKTEPLLLKEENSKFLQLLGDKYKFYPLYFVKWDRNQPLTLKDIKDIESIDIKQQTLKPNMVRKLAETRVFQGLFQQGGSGLLSEGSKTKMMYGLVVIVGIIIYLYMFTDII